MIIRRILRAALTHSYAGREEYIWYVDDKLRHSVIFPHPILMYTDKCNSHGPKGHGDWRLRPLKVKGLGHLTR